jgi:hypothetical protein
MTVAKLIEHLKTLDQDRGIWVFYDCGYYVFPPIPDRNADKTDESARDEVRSGDYIISAG